MTKYRGHLPQLADRLFLTDGGIETDLIFNGDFELPHFAAFHLLKDEKGLEALRAYYTRYAAIARDNSYGFILESPTWRASSDWGDKLGYSRPALAAINARAIDLMSELRERFDAPNTPVVISGCVGPRGDGYVPDHVPSREEAESYHAAQIGVFAKSDADLVTAITMTMRTKQLASLARRSPPACQSPLPSRLR